MSRHVHLYGVLCLSLFLMTGCVTLTGETAEENYRDTTITTAVKSQLVVNERVGTLRSIDVKTIKGTVYLGGTAASTAEKERAEQIAWNIDGVEDVVNEITVKKLVVRD